MVKFKFKFAKRRVLTTPQENDRLRYVKMSSTFLFCNIYHFISHYNRELVKFACFTIHFALHSTFFRLENAH